MAPRSASRYRPTGCVLAVSFTTTSISILLHLGRHHHHHQGNRMAPCGSPPPALLLATRSHMQVMLWFHGCVPTVVQQNGQVRAGGTV